VTFEAGLVVRAAARKRQSDVREHDLRCAVERLGAGEGLGCTLERTVVPLARDVEERRTRQCVGHAVLRVGRAQIVERGIE